VSSSQLGRHEAEGAQLQRGVHAALDRRPDASTREERGGSRGGVREELDQRPGELATPAARLDHQGDARSMLLLSPGEVLALLGRLGAGRSTQGTLGGPGPGEWLAWGGPPGRRRAPAGRPASERVSA